jgi:hypothetical protein
MNCPSIKITRLVGTLLMFCSSLVAARCQHLLQTSWPLRTSSRSMLARKRRRSVTLSNESACALMLDERLRHGRFGIIHTLLFELTAP